MEIEWVSRGMVIARIGDRSIRVGGEYLVNHDPDFLIYARTVTAWDDGTPVSELERAEILDEVVDAASRQGWKFAISWDELNLKEAMERYAREGEASRRPAEGADLGEPPDR
jgi:hypothetical protein